MSCSIGEIHKVDYQQMLKKYAYHSMLLCLLDQNECKNIRREVFLLDNIADMAELDYDKALKE